MADFDNEKRLEKGVDEASYARDSDESSLSSVGAQAGTKGVEAITLTWTTWSLVLAYVGIFLLATAVSLEQQSTLGLSIFATSSFQSHSLVSTVYVIQGVVNACFKPVMAKICNVFGRLEAFSFSVFLYMLGYIQMAASKNVQTFAAAQIFYSAGFTGILIITQIFVADTTDLKWRALFSSLPDVPFLATVWIGPLITARLVSNWRWGYGLWAIVLPVAFIPLVVSLTYALIKAKKQGVSPPRPWHGQSAGQYLVKLWFDLDVLGLLVLSAAISLILLPLTLAPLANGGWSNPSMIAMEVVGCICLVAFPFVESSKVLAPSPFFPLRLLKTRNVVIGLVAGTLYFAVFYTSVFPYFNTYLQVVQSQSVVAAGHITQTFSFSSTVASIIVSILIRLTKHHKAFIIAGAGIYLLGIGLLVRYRDESVSIGSNVGIQIAVGIGGGMFNVPMQVAVQASSAHVDVATVTALFLTFVEIGGSIGSAISGAIWSGNLGNKLAEYLPTANASDATIIVGNFSRALDYPVGTIEREGINRAYQETMRLILIVSVCLAAPLFLLTLFVKSQHLAKIDQPVAGKVIGTSHAEGGVDGSELPAGDEGQRTRRPFWQRLRR